MCVEANGSLGHWTLFAKQLVYAVLVGAVRVVPKRVTDDGCGGGTKRCGNNLKLFDCELCASCDTSFHCAFRPVGECRKPLSSAPRFGEPVDDGAEVLIERDG